MKKFMLLFMFVSVIAYSNPFLGTWNLYDMLEYEADTRMILEISNERVDGYFYRDDKLIFQFYESDIHYSNNYISIRPDFSYYYKQVDDDTFLFIIEPLFEDQYSYYQRQEGIIYNDAGFIEDYIELNFSNIFDIIFHENPEAVFYLKRIE